MENFDARDYIIHKALAQNIIDELTLIYQKNNENVLKVAETCFSLMQQFENAKNIVQAEQLSIQLDEYKKKLVQYFSVNEKLELLITRNKNRIKYFDWRISVEKVINFDVNKKQLSSRIEKENVKIEDNLLNINLNKDSIISAFYNGQLLQLQDSKLSFENPQNYEILKSVDENDFKSIMDKFPSSLMTITDLQLLDIKFKQQILKQIITISDAKLKSYSIKKINDYFGKPLTLSNYTPKDISEFVSEITNLFNVRTKKYLEENYPEYIKEINSKLKCNEKSLTLTSKYAYKEEIEEDDSYDNTEKTSSTVEQDEDDEFNNFLMGLLNMDDEDEENN